MFWYDLFTLSKIDILGKLGKTHQLHYLSVIFTGRNEVVAKVMFLHVSVILFTGGVGVSGQTPWTRQTPPPGQGRENPPLAGRPPWDHADPPRPGRHPINQAGTPPGPGRHPPQQGEHPPTRQAPTPPPPGPGRPPPRPARPPLPPAWEEDCSIRSMSGRYASYWNAFLFHGIVSGL